MKKQIKDLKVGDVVLYKGNHNVEYLLTIDRETKKYWGYESMLFDKVSGYARGGSVWNNNSINVISDDEIKVFKDKRENEKLARNLKNVAYDKYSTDTLKKVLDVLLKGKLK